MEMGEVLFERDKGVYRGETPKYEDGYHNLRGDLNV